MNWDFEFKLPANVSDQIGRLCMSKTSGSSGALIPMGDFKCAFVPLLGGQKTFYYNSLFLGMLGKEELPICASVPVELFNLRSPHQNDEVEGC